MLCAELGTCRRLSSQLVVDDGRGGLGLCEDTIRRLCVAERNRAVVVSEVEGVCCWSGWLCGGARRGSASRMRSAMWC